MGQFMPHQVFARIAVRVKFTMTKDDVIAKSKGAGIDGRRQVASLSISV
jgi:hypothetical protein